MREGIYNKNTFFVFVFFHFQEIACLVMFISEIQRGTFGYVKNTRYLYHYNVQLYCASGGEIYVKRFPWSVL